MSWKRSYKPLALPTLINFDMKELEVNKVSSKKSAHFFRNETMICFFWKFQIEPSEIGHTSKIKRFLKIVKCFRKTLYLSCLPRFCIRLCQLFLTLSHKERKGKTTMLKESNKQTNRWTNIWIHKCGKNGI